MYLKKKEQLFNWIKGLNICERLWIFCLLLKIWVKTCGKSMTKILSGKYSRKVDHAKHVKLIQKEQFKKQLKQPVI